MNHVEIIGQITNDFTKEEVITIGKEVLYKNFISIQRDSGVCDEIPIIVNYNTSYTKGNRVHIYGTFRSFNYHGNDKNKLLLYVFVDEMTSTDVTKDVNMVKLDGFLCKKPNLRKTPLGKTICDVNIAVNTNSKHSDYIPCIFWGDKAKNVSDKDVGENISITGRIQSRVYRKLVCERYENMVAYEVSVNHTF